MSTCQSVLYCFINTGLIYVHICFIISKKLLYFTVPIDQVAVPVGGKAYLPCDTRNEDLGKSRDSSGFFMVMWFKEQKENNPLDQSYEQAGQSSSSILPTSGEPIFT